MRDSRIESGFWAPAKDPLSPAGLLRGCDEPNQCGSCLNVSVVRSVLVVTKLPVARGEFVDQLLFLSPEADCFVALMAD